MKSPDIKKVGDYNFNISTPIGAGSYGKVYLGYPKNFPQTLLAIKQISIPANEKMRIELTKTLGRETGILKSLKNKNIVKFYDGFLTKNNVYMIFEYCDGGDLEVFRKKSPNYRLSEAQTLLFMRHICNGYKDLLNKNIIHRDLKPNNIFLQDGEAKIGDFGTARHIDPQELLKFYTQFIGTPLYMSPEMYEPKGYDSRCDVWSFGIMIYELLYGVTPWTGEGEYKLFMNITNQKLDFPKEPRRTMGIKLLLRKMLVINPLQRITWQEVFQEISNFEEIDRSPVNEKKNPKNALENEKSKKIKKKKKNAIGDLNEFEFDEKSEEKPKEEHFDEIRNDDIFKNTLKPLDNESFITNYKAMEAHKKLTEKNKLVAKEYKDIIYFQRNLAYFFENFAFLFQLINAKNILEIKKNLMDKIIYQLELHQKEYLIKAQNTFFELSKKNILSFHELKRINFELYNNYEEVIPSKPINSKNDDDSLKVYLNDFLKYNIHVINDDEILSIADYNEEFFKLLIYCILILKANKIEEILKDEFNYKELSQIFYLFYEKYEMMEKTEFIEEIRYRLKNLKL